jgi:predicted phosphodiesterase
MRWGVISDVHANVHALDAALAALERECVERIASLGASTVVTAGNHDLMAIGRLPAEGIAPLAKQTIDWTADALSDDARRYLEALPESELTDDGTVVAHGSLDDPVEYVFDGAAAREQLALVAERHPDARVLVLGHTHLHRAFGPEGDQATDGEIALGDHRWLLNAGSVGQSRERRALARTLLLDLDRRSARFLAVDYDVRATKAELRAAGLPEHACHLAPGRRARVRRKLKAALTS